MGVAAFYILPTSNKKGCFREEAITIWREIYVSFNLPSLLDPSLYILNFVVKINLDKSYDYLCNTFRYPNLQVIIHSFPSNARPPSEFPNKILTEVCM